MRYRNRIQFSLWVLTGFFLLAALFAILLSTLTPETPAARVPLLLVSFSVILLSSLLCILFLLRWVLRPYRRLVGEAERTSIAASTSKSKGEAEFVLETFQSVVAQLQLQQNELERLSAQASERADSAERFNERIVASVPSGLIAFDDGGRAMVINSPGRDLLGVDGKALGEPAGTLLCKAPSLAEMVARCLSTGEVYRREEIEAVDTEGRTRRLGATIAPIDLSPEGGARGALCLISDITEVTQLREQVALKRNLESLGEMSAGLAHEFKNAIATLHGYAQLLQNLELDERGRTAASSMLNEVRNLSEMVTAFLNFARPQPLELDDVPVDQLIKECATELGSLFNERRVELVLDLGKQTGDEVLVIRADERMLRQALLNLLRNATEAIAEDKEERRIYIHSHRDEGTARKACAVVVVRDTGQGIPASDLQRIFIPFFTTKAKGHGVGLALAHRVISDHGGTLTAGNASEGGATFTLRLPI
jgi:PAS domain S-box-containing protein